MNDTIQELLTLAVRAPSPDNTQPWRFEVKDNVLDVFMVPEKDNPIFNYRHRGTLLTHGCLLENVAIAAPKFGYQAHISEFPEPDNLIYTARIVLEKISPFENLLYPYIEKRCTNRKMYQDIPLTYEQRAELLKSGEAVGGGKVLFAESAEQKKIIGQAVSVNEIVMLEHKGLHDLFYNDIRWTTKSERRLKWGLYLKTMELKPPQVAIFKL